MVVKVRKQKSSDLISRSRWTFNYTRVDQGLRDMLWVLWIVKTPSSALVFSLLRLFTHFYLFEKLWIGSLIALLCRKEFNGFDDDINDGLQQHPSTHVQEWLKERMDEGFSGDIVEHHQLQINTKRDRGNLLIRKSQVDDPLITSSEWMVIKQRAETVTEWDPMTLWLISSDGIPSTRNPKSKSGHCNWGFYFLFLTRSHRSTTEHRVPFLFVLLILPPSVPVQRNLSVIRPNPCPLLCSGDTVGLDCCVW